MIFTGEQYQRQINFLKEEVIKEIKSKTDDELIKLLTYFHHIRDDRYYIITKEIMLERMKNENNNNSNTKTN